MIDLLFVDDDPGLREIAQFFFETDPGFRADMASSADEALVKMSKKRYDAIISDHCMPHRNGIEFLMDVRKTIPGLPFVMYSATRDVKVVKDALNNGADLFMEKSGNIIENLERMAPHLRALVAKHREEECFETDRTQVQQVIDGLSESIVLTDTDLIITGANRKANDVLGAGDLKGRNLVGFVHGEDLDMVVDSLWRSMSDRRSPPIRFRLRTGSNFERPMEMSASLLGHAMKMTGFALSIREIGEGTTLGRIEERNRDLEALVDLTCHEVADHLDVAEKYIRALNSTALDPYKKRYAEEALKRMSLLEDRMRLITLYKCMGTAKPIWQDLGRAVQRACEGVELGAVQLDRDTDRFEVLADPLLDEALKNIISGSAKKTNGASAISVSCQVSLGGLTLVIEDDGVGILQEDKDALFNYSGGRSNWHGLHFTKRLLMVTGISIREVGMSTLGSRFEVVIPDGRFNYLEEEEDLLFQAAHRVKAAN